MCLSCVMDVVKITATYYVAEDGGNDSLLLVDYMINKKAEGVAPTIRLKRPLNELSLSKPTEWQTSETGLLALNNSVAFSILTKIKYW